MNVLQVTLRELKRHEGAYGANDPAYDNSGLSDVVDDWGIFGLTSRFTGHYICNIRRKPPIIYDNEKDRKRLGHRGSCPRGSASDSGPGLVLDRSGLAKVTDRMRIRRPVSWLCLSGLSRQKEGGLRFNSLSVLTLSTLCLFPRSVIPNGLTLRSLEYHLR
ncbi:hypothetical protein PIB30_058297 [Stylosanthes scabra]|uniref:Uncharacterized protein n=1 Tax=Stylosanthes scabra TaxID=79078 RepID=A0ABU6ZIM9_9FABA|nr:hypothetical protein [Stylosanthes scabra]